MAPEFPATAAAQAEGAISPEHARVITATIAALPAERAGGEFDEIEPELAGYARRFGLDQFRLLARHLGDVLDPGRHPPRRQVPGAAAGLNVRQRPDGSVSGSFEGTAEFGEALLSLLDKSAAPDPEADGAKDPRTPAQRRHDGLLDAMKLLLRSGQLGDCNGVSTTIIFTMTAEQAHTGTAWPAPGTAPRPGPTRAREHRRRPHLPGHPRRPRTHHRAAGSRPATCACSARVKPVAAYGTTHRIFTEGQRLAMIARDKGCSFPGCTVGPQWCEAHHVTEWQYGRRTCIDDGALLCGYHHREFENLGWHCLMINGVPHYRAAPWLDGERTPHRNTAHDITAA